VVNDRIRKIAIEADAWCDKYYFGDKFYDIEWEKKFAELIVRECVGVVEGGRFLHPQAPTAIFAKECSDAIKRHFGVAE
jgi:hypothetical protein